MKVIADFPGWVIAYDRHYKKVKETKASSSTSNNFLVKHFYRRCKFLAVETSQQTNTSTLYFANASASMGEPDGALSMFGEEQFYASKEKWFAITNPQHQLLPTDSCCCHCHLRSVL